MPKLMTSVEAKRIVYDARKVAIEEAQAQGMSQDTIRRRGDAAVHRERERLWREYGVGWLDD